MPSFRIGTMFSPACNYSGLPQLGVGIGYRHAFRASLFQHQQKIDFLEITADHFFVNDQRTNDELTLLKNNFHLIPHGLALSLGSADGIDSEYLARFARIVDRVEPAWCSDHIAFTRAGGIDIGHLTSLPKTKASLRVLKENIARVQDRIAIPLILENITESIRYPDDQYDDASFLCEVCEQNDVGILLDVTNLYMNSINHRFDAIKVLRQLPADRIVQLHFVGGKFENGKWIDSHSTPTTAEIWDLLEEVLMVADVKGMILERDEQIPPLEQLLPELAEARTRRATADLKKNSHATRE
jgi:uncharacterized protein